MNNRVIITSKVLSIFKVTLSLNDVLKNYENNVYLNYLNLNS